MTPPLGPSGAARSLVAMATAWACILSSGRELHADEDTLDHGDRTASLYRDVLRVGSDGKPTLPLSVLSGQGVLEVSAPSGLRILGTGDGQVDIRIPAGRSVEVRSTAAKAGVYAYYVILAQAAAGDFELLRSQKALWRDRGFAVRALASGTTYSLAGRMFDTRQTLLCLDQRHPTEAVAQARARELASQYGVELGVQVVVDTPPSAELVLRDRGGQAFEIHARDVVWFEALAEPAQPSSGPADTSLRVAGVRQGGRAELDLPGRIYVMAGQRGLEVINEAALEMILEGVVASEIFHSAPDAALRAQAVAARTDMLAKVGTRHATDPFAICSEVHCQAYRGLERVSPRIAQAVRDTRGLVLVDAEGKLVDAYYHAVSGGHTEHNELVWPGRPQSALRGRPDLVSGTSPLSAGPTEQAVHALVEGKDDSWAAASGLNGDACRWRVERSAAELLQQLQPFGIRRMVRELRVTQRGVSGRAIGLLVTTEDGQQHQVDGELRIRDALGGSHGPRGLRSSLITIRPGPNHQGVPQSWTFFGAGFGHGVGMDQTGAVARAKAGQDFKTILLHYYAGATLQKLY